jgi:uncharacterized protein (DUF2267 family)
MDPRLLDGGFMRPRITEAELVARVAAHAGIRDARGVTDAVLAEIGAHLTPETRAQLAGELPIAFGSRGGDLGPEVVASVCHALAEALSVDVLAALRRELPPAIAGYLESAPAYAPSVRTRGRTLAAGQPGSARSLATARPRAAQSNSVADENPHADTKLSSSAGTTQERERESIAEGRPGSSRPLHLVTRNRPR